MDIIQQHFEAFVQSIGEFADQEAVGQVPLNFINRFIDSIPEHSTQKYNDLMDHLPAQLLSRNEVFLICNDDNKSLLYKTICVFAWGGMSRINPVRFFRNWDIYQEDIHEVLQNLRLGKIDRMSAYNFLRIMELDGCGPAYFTKLLYFFSNGTAYIMDQWTGKSIELLFSENCRIGIHFLNGGSIARNNRGYVYEAFCSRIERISNLISAHLGYELSPQKTEEFLFSNGGVNPGQWRQYVVNHWH